MKTYAGIHVPLVTPFSEGTIDWKALGALIDAYVAAGVASVIPCGTTGESCTLTHDEHRAVIDFAIQRVARRIPVIAGTGSNNTAEAIALTQHAARAGAGAALVVSPYYNRPSQEGIYRYYADIARAVPGFDLLIYNIPARTGSNVEFATVRRLAESVPTIRGIKEGSGNIQYLLDLAHHFAGTDFTILTGEDTLLFSLCAAGGDGGIMAAAGVCPHELVEMFKFLAAGELERARTLDRRLRPLVTTLFKAVNPVCVKYAVSRRFGVPYEVRPPLVAADAALRDEVASALTRAELTALAATARGESAAWVGP